MGADASITAIAREWRSEANDTQARPADGYGPIITHLADPIHDRIAFDTRVERIAWSADRVVIDAVCRLRAVRVEARCAIITLPIGVLRDGSVTFEPDLPPHYRRAIESIAMGPVVKVVLEFRSQFWNEGFYQTPRDCAFPTVWSRLPQRATVL